MRTVPLAVVTSMPNSGAALFVKWLADRGAVPKLLLIDGGGIDSRGSYLRARFKKIRKRGIFGPLISRRLIGRAMKVVEYDGRALCSGLSIRVVEVSSINHPDAVAALNDAEVLQAVSLGNRYIRPHILKGFNGSIFNLHHGSVPDYRGGPPVFWEIYDGLDEVGYTFHKIDEGIDTGDVVLSGNVAMRYEPTLVKTLSATWADLLPRSINAIVDEVIERFPLGATPVPQKGRGTFRTSPRMRDVIKVARRVREKNRETEAPS